MGEKVANTLTERKENYYKNLLQIERLINKEEEGRRGKKIHRPGGRISTNTYFTTLTK